MIPFISFILVYKWFHSLFFFITKVNLDNSDSLDVLHRLFECLAPIVFRPVDILLKTLLQAPTGIVSRSHLNVWKKQLKTFLHISPCLSPWKKEKKTAFTCSNPLYMATVCKTLGIALCLGMFSQNCALFKDILTYLFLFREALRTFSDGCAWCCLWFEC